MQIAIQPRWKKYQIQTNQNSHRRKSLFSHVFIAGILFSGFSSFIPTPASGQINNKPATFSLGQQLLQEVIKCTEAKSFNQKITNQAQSEALQIDVLCKL
jgi:hypothetical protein